MVHKKPTYRHILETVLGINVIDISQFKLPKLNGADLCIFDKPAKYFPYFFELFDDDIITRIWHVVGSTLPIEKQSIILQLNEEVSGYVDEPTATKRRDVRKLNWRKSHVCAHWAKLLQRLHKRRNIFDYRKVRSKLLP